MRLRELIEKDRRIVSDEDLTITVSAVFAAGVLAGVMLSALVVWLVLVL